VSRTRFPMRENSGSCPTGALAIREASKSASLRAKLLQRHDEVGIALPRSVTTSLTGLPGAVRVARTGALATAMSQTAFRTVEAIARHSHL